MAKVILERETRYMCALGVPSNNTTAVDVYAIPINVEISEVSIRVAVPAADGGAVTVSVGDDDAAAGYVEAGDAKAAKGTVYGDAITERGAYQVLNPGTDDGPIPPKRYTTSGKEIKLVLSASATTQGQYDVYWKETPVPISPD